MRRKTQAEQRWIYYKSTFYVDDLVNEAGRISLKLLQEGAEELDGIKDMTVGEMLQQIDELERMQLTLSDIMDKVSDLETVLGNVVKMITKSIKANKEDGDAEGIRELKEFATDMNRVMEKMGEIKEMFMDPDGDAMVTMEKFSQLCQRIQGAALSNVDTIMTELEVDSWSNLHLWLNKILDTITDYVPADLAPALKNASTVVRIIDGASKAYKWLQKKFAGVKGSGVDPDKALEQMVNMAASEPDTKFRTAPFFELFNIDDEYLNMLDEDVQAKFIKWYISYLKEQKDDILIKDLDIDSTIEKWLPRQPEYKGATVTKVETSDTP